jgi:putative N6-adenine-specific DNA methylase
MDQDFDFKDNFSSLRRTAIGKKIKKNREKIFPVFASIPPGFSSSALKEAKLKLNSLQNLHITKGGISFNGSLEDVIKANLLLGIPSKILLRLSKFRVFNFDTLENEIEKIPFELFLFKNSKIQISASSRKSKLIHSSAIEERVLKSVLKRLEKEKVQNFSKTSQYAKILIRISRDTAVVSVDSSGEPLYKRGLKKLTVKAPIRENLAFAGLFNSNYNPDFAFFDPMCGCGTFSGEAALIASNTFPGKFRHFAFENWPLYDNDLHKKIILEENEKIIDFRGKIFTSDISFKNVETAKKNYLDPNLSKNMSFFCSDFFSIKKQKNPGTIAINPPYGIRIEKEKKLIKNIGEKLKKDFYAFNLLLTIPKSFQDNYFSEKNFDLIPFVHGGIEMNLVTGKIN